MTSHAMDILSQSPPSTHETRWFAPFACVVYKADVVEVFVSGLLIGTFAPKDVLTRNFLLVGLSKERNIKKGQLSEAFGISDEQRRRICKIASEQGIAAIPGRPRGGSELKLKAGTRKRIHKLFADGLRPVQVFRRIAEKHDVSYTTILRLHQAWRANTDTDPQEESVAARESEEQRAASQLRLVSSNGVEPATNEGLPSSGPGDADLEDNEGVTAAPVRSGKMVQHAGGLLLVTLLHSYGLYAAAMNGWAASAAWRDRLRMAIDAIVLSLGIGQKCVEGVRRLETSTAPILFRCNHPPSESWIRRIIKRYVDGSGMANKLHLRMTGVYLNASRSKEDVPAIFYVDNHMRPYTGKQTIRKGWRMQEKRAVPGTTDYYVHDEDGRPVCRVDVPSHDSLTDWLSPIAELLRGGLEGGQRILLAFDRAGAFPENMARLRDTGVEFVTYERRPYQVLPKTAFTEEVTLDGGEVMLVHEERLANLGKGRGRVRRIALLTEDGSQVNLLAYSREPAWRLIEIITGRWVQENGFKHGKERWGFNQLDRRKTLEYDPETIIPNPARRRLEFSLRIAAEQEGRLRRKLARLDDDSKRRPGLEAHLSECLNRQAELLAERPHLPTHASLKDTELAGLLTYHDNHYKTVIDTIRIACANAESELASALADKLNKPAEAKKVLANVFHAPGDIKVNDKSITISLKLTGRKDERGAIARLFDEINDWKLSLPGDPGNRPLRFKSQI